MPADPHHTSTFEVSVAEALLAIGAVGFRPHDPILFKSGILSPVYCDNRIFPFWPAHWKTVINGFAALVQDLPDSTEVIAGIEAAGIPHSAALGYTLALPSVFVRKQPKEHGKRAHIEGGDVQGKRVLLVEDLVTTGGSSLSGVAALREAGATVTDCLAIISYGFAEAVDAFAQAGVQLHTLTGFDAVLRQAVRNKLLDDEGEATLRDWLADPHGWAQRRSRP